ncbi:3-hydroxyacyl-CoA dehydrogenase family protein [Clostridium vitabionis]|uniref:3-hydroxyacyl-CoA dehydrogenase family protein n=1 Tax=Clostridium vitabionis TaxID=2784388 RepID=UPI002E27C047|nr:3-hydroxyacyl-CoA dehydrogenase family protein [Clostridium vitabionis]
MTDIKNVLVVGAGTMGSSIAMVFAANGYKTVMADIKQEFIDRAFTQVDKSIAWMKENDLLSSDDYENAVKANLTGILNGEIPARGKEFDLVIEVVPENKHIKRSTYEMLSESCREDCIFASNTSGMDVFSLTDSFLKNPSRLVITHWFNPPYLMKIIEVVQGPKTADAVGDKMREVLESCGKKPSVLRKYIPGFIVNRLATAICRELYYMIEQGWVSAQDAENALKYTDGLRWSFEGPIELWDFVGHEITLAVAGDVIPTLCNATDKFPLADEIFRTGHTGVRAGEGVLKKYTGDFDAYVAKRNSRILTMYKVMNKFEEEDK